VEVETLFLSYGEGDGVVDFQVFVFIAKSAVGSGAVFEH